MEIKRTASVTWQGGLKDGTGSVSTQSGALAGQPFAFGSRFQTKRGTNPEELIAAAHASCFTMALSAILGEANLTAERIETSAEVSLQLVDGEYAITSVHLILRAMIPGAEQALFDELASKAKATCPVSKLLNAEIELDAKLIT